MKRRRHTTHCALILAAALSCSHVWAQQYPAKPVRMIVPFATGGSADIIGRIMAQQLTRQLGQQFIVENRAGAGGLLGMETAVKSAPDGYTIMLSTGSLTTTAAIYKPVWDPVNNITPVAELGFSPLVLSVHPSLPVKTTRELIALARAKPNQLLYPTPGVGSITHLAMEYFVSMAKIRIVNIPYKTVGGAAMTELLAGQTQTVLGGLLTLHPYIESKRLRPLAVSTIQRWPTLPDVPPLADTVPGYRVDSWFGVVAPKAIPAAALTRLNTAINDVLKEPEMKKSLETQGLIPSGGTPEEFNKRIRSDYERWLRVVKDADIKPE